MAFVTCEAHNKVKDAQQAQQKTLAALQEQALSADDALVDQNAGQGGGKGKITVEKIKAVVEGNVAVAVQANSGIEGDGTSANPLALKLSDDLALTADGKLYINTLPKQVSNLNQGDLTKLGLQFFSGKINNTGGQSLYVTGVPMDFNSAQNSQNSTSVVGELAPNQDYDFNGYQIASPLEVNQYILNNGTVWQRTNESGMRADGTLNDPNAWSAWKKETNVNLTRAEFDALLNRAKELETRASGLEQALATANQKLAALEAKNQETCKVPIKTVGSYTLAETDNTLLSTGGTISVPENLPVGRMFTVIQTQGVAVTLAGQGQMVLVPPMDGTLTLAGAGAVVTILVTAPNQARVFGQTG